MDKEAAARRQKDIFENYPVPKAVMSMAVPTVISQLIILIYNMADTWFIGLTNDPYKVAGCSIVMPLFMLSIIISNLFGTGGGTLVSRLLGVKDNDEPHIALANIRERLEMMCKGTLTVSEREGGGTVVSIFVSQKHD